MKLSEFNKEYIEYSRGHHAPNTVIANELAMRMIADFCNDIDIKRGTYAR